LPLGAETLRRFSSFIGYGRVETGKSPDEYGLPGAAGHRKVMNPGRPTTTVDGRYAMAVPTVRESR